MCFSDVAKFEKVKEIKKLEFVGEDPPAGVTVGWRAWKVERTGGAVRLVSPIQTGTIWDPGKPVKGKPNEKNREGVYAIAKLKDLKTLYGKDLESKDVVVGLVVLFGSVGTHAKGYRAEKAYPLRLWTNDFMLEVPLRDEYKCSVKRLPARVLYEDSLKVA